MCQIILASQSPRRRELMELIGFPFTVKVSDMEEIITSHDPAAVTEELSWQKAYAVAADFVDGEEVIVIGADTVEDNRQRRLRSRIRFRRPFSFFPF